MKTSTFLPIFALAASVLASPPACLLNAVNEQPSPANLGALCAPKTATAVQSAIASLCSNQASAAQSAFIATCSGAGSSVAPYSGSSGKTTAAGSQSSGTYVYTTAVYNSDCSCTTTIVTSATGAAAPSQGLTASGTATSGSGAATQTGNVAADVKGMGSFAAAAVAVAGAIAAL